MRRRLAIGFCGLVHATLEEACAAPSKVRCAAPFAPPKRMQQRVHAFPPPPESVSVPGTMQFGWCVCAGTALEQHAAWPCTYAGSMTSAAAGVLMMVTLTTTVSGCVKAAHAQVSCTCSWGTCSKLRPGFGSRPILLPVPNIYCHHTGALLAVEYAS